MKISIPENKFSENASKALLIEDSPTGYLLWHSQTNRFMNSRHTRCNEKMIYKNLKESPEKPEIRISENTEKSEMSEEENTDANQRSEITEIPELPKPIRGKSLKRKGAHKEVTEPSHKIRILPTRESKTNPKKRSRVCIQS